MILTDDIKNHFSTTKEWELRCDKCKIPVVVFYVYDKLSKPSIFSDGVCLCEGCTKIHKLN